MNCAHYTVGPISDAIDEYASIACESLLCPGRDLWRTFVARVGCDNLRGVYDGSRLMGGMAFYRAAHWFGGKEIACGGFSGVAMNPADRGSGGCGLMLRSVLGELRREGIPLASLYASTQYLYRSVGFEHAGTQTQYSIPMSSIRSTDRELPIHRFQSPPIDKLNHVARVRAARTNGNFSRTDGLWQRLLDPHGGNGTITYILGEMSAPEGYVILCSGSRDGGVPQPLVSTDLAVTTPAALRRMLTLIRDHRSMCDSFQWYGPPQDSLIFFADEQWVSVKSCMRWMLRIIDLPAALSQRGYSPSFAGTLDLEVEDDLLGENSGRWQLSIEAGSATVRRGGEGKLRMNIRGLAPLFSSYYAAEELVRLGVIHSSDECHLTSATQAFAGEAPWLPELF